MNEYLLSTPRFSVERRVFTQKDGRAVVREVVVHPGAVVILPILADGRIVLIRNHRFTIDQELLELPAGTREPGEEPVATARRELEEETGYSAARITPLIEFYTSPGILTERMYAFVATELTEVGQRLEATERILVSPREESEIREMLRRGAFHDGKSIAVLATYFLRKER